MTQVLRCDGCRQLSDEIEPGAWLTINADLGRSLGVACSIDCAKELMARASADQAELPDSMAGLRLHAVPRPAKEPERL